MNSSNNVVFLVILLLAILAQIENYQVLTASWIAHLMVTFCMFLLELAFWNPCLHQLPRLLQTFVSQDAEEDNEKSGCWNYDQFGKGPTNHQGNI